MRRLLIALSATFSLGNGFTFVERKNCKLQWAVSCRPRHYWKHDKNPGDVSKDGVIGVWHVVR